MQITSNSKQYLIVDDFFNESELKSLWEELGILQSKDVLQPPSITAGAKGEDGNIIKKNSGIFLDDYYENREDSSILNMYDKYICEEVYEKFPTMSPEFKYAFYVNFDRTLLNYYENNDHYKPSFEYQETFNFLSSDEISIFTDGTFTPSKIYIAYMRYPVYIDKEGYIKFDGTPSVDQDCELETYLEDELLDLTVQNLAMYTENQSAVQNATYRIQTNE
jgi:hypothetical protein